MGGAIRAFTRVFDALWRYPSPIPASRGSMGLPASRSGMGIAALHPSYVRLPIVFALAVLVLLPVGIVVYQSFLDEPFFVPAAKLSLWAYEFILAEPDFAR